MNTLTQHRPRVKSNTPLVHHGSCRWLYAPGCFTCGPNAGVLLVNDTRYVVQLYAKGAPAPAASSAPR